MDRGTDGQVVARVLRGDVEEYGILVARYRDRYARYALHMLGNREDAEEACNADYNERIRRGIERAPVKPVKPVKKAPKV